MALLASSVLAQTSIHSALSGRVVDPSGATVSGVQISLTNRDTNQAMEAASGEDGLFTFGRLLPGNYNLTAEKTGFQRLQREGLQVAVNQVATLTLNLSVGEVTTTVNVQGDASPIQTQNADVSLLIDNTRLRDLPLNGKDFQKLMFLAPGVGNFRSNNPNSNASVSGSREASNNYVIDGVSSNDERETAGLALGASFRQQPNVISTEALQEFRIITSNADATFGRGSGAQVNIVTRSGTNEFHGSAYEYLRNSALDARDFFNYGPYFDDQGRAKTPPFRQNLFGATLGGPLRRNKHFFFASYEGFRQRLETTGSPTVPTADLVRLFPGDFGRLSRAFYFDQNVV
ncbi:MAG: carboxypeptidase regulatory-like domain-containing protein, partial [Bryobacteraceae bacterium]|nr:carboxypeptidase regulatory-like domain-containing protein [Bryobacteraceae bacterium]